MANEINILTVHESIHLSDDYLNPLIQDNLKNVRYSLPDFSSFTLVT